MPVRYWKLAVASALLLGAAPGLGAWAQAVPAAAQQDEKQDDKQSEAEKNLLPLGQVAPDFTLPLVGGGEVTLADLLKFGKATLVGFWGIDAEAGGEAILKAQKVHEELSQKGLSTITVNPRDRARDIEKFIKSSNLHIQVAIDGKETNSAVTSVFKARTLPTFYLLDPSGKVLWRSIGFKEPGLRAALEKAGVK
ncbi:MAG: peroxiredoxin family protein [Armatimonadota bacterium]